MSPAPSPISNPHEDVLNLLRSDNVPDANQFKRLVQSLDNHRILAKVFVLEGTPYVFKNSPMKYVIFREQVADQFDVGSQDVCIVGSAKLGFSPSPRKFGTPFTDTSDVDVVIVSSQMFDDGSRELFKVINGFQPALHEIFHRSQPGADNQQLPQVDLRDWRTVKGAVRNFVFQNFNPGLLPNGNGLRSDIFERISSTAGLFLALEPQVFVGKIRARVFRTWRAAEDYYANSLREAKRAFAGQDIDDDIQEEDSEAS